MSRSCDIHQMMSPSWFSARTNISFHVRILHLTHSACVPPRASSLQHNAEILSYFYNIATIDMSIHLFQKGGGVRVDHRMTSSPSILTASSMVVQTSGTSRTNPDCHTQLETTKWSPRPAIIRKHPTITDEVAWNLKWTRCQGLQLQAPPA
jgi:hypothetical protein